MIKKLSLLKERLSQEKGKRELLKSQVEKTAKEKVVLETFYENALKARAIVQIVAENVQKKIEFQISTLVSAALASVFKDPYQFSLRFIQRRNKTECDLIFSKNGNETSDIVNSGGGGVCDVASCALRISLWSIKKNRPTIILDEVSKFLHNPIYQQKFSDLLKRVSEELKLQFIVVTDQKELLKAADKVIEIINVDGISKVAQ